jgi:hypothetical protein
MTIDQGLKNINKREIEEQEQQIIVEHNLNLMRTGMRELLRYESIGGNAGFVKIDGKNYSCAGANGFADRDSGSIAEFNNIQNASQEALRKKNGGFIFRVAFDTNFGFFKILGVFYGEGKNDLGSKGQFSSKAKMNISRAVERWNEEKQATRVKKMFPKK